MRTKLSLDKFWCNDGLREGIILLLGFGLVEYGV